MRTEDVKKMIIEKFESLSQKNNIPVSGIKLFIALKDLAHFNVFFQEVRPEKIIEILPVAIRLTLGGRIHKYVSHTLKMLAQNESIDFGNINARLTCSDSKQLSLTLMNQYKELRPITVEELFKLNE